MTERYLCFFPTFCTWKQVDDDGADICRVDSSGNQCPYCKGEIGVAREEVKMAMLEVTACEEALRKAKDKYEKAQAHEEKVKAESLGED